MEIVVAILVIVALAAVAFAVMQRRPGGTSRRGPRSSPGTVRTRRAPRSDPMTAAVVEHAQVTDPAEVPAAEARLKAQAQQVAAGMQGDAQRVERQRAAEQLGAADPAIDPRYDPADPRYDEADPRYDPRYDDRAR